MGGGEASLTRCFAFGDLPQGLWGAAWIPPGAQATVAIGNPRGATTVTGQLLDGDPGAATWEVQLGSERLVLGAVGEPVRSGATEVCYDQLCETRGVLAIEGQELELQAAGWMALREDESSLSFRRAAAWFGPGEGVALTALREPGAASHDRDLVSAAVFEEQGAQEAEDPRLSTTYGPDGHPARAGLELWLSSGEEDDLRPVRAAGEAAGPAADWSVAGTHLHAQLFRWHSRGREGAGVYMLGNPQ